MVRPISPPLRIQGDRFVLRCWDPEDAGLLKEAFSVSFDELDRWIPWLLEEGAELAQLTARLESYRDHFLEGGDALYAILDLEEEEILGGIGLYRRVGPSALEIGYWVRSDMAGQGIGTAATAMLTEAGLTLPGVDRIQVHCDPENGASVAIPRKLGFRLRETRRDVLPQSGEMATTMIWEITSEMLSRAYAES